MKPKEIIVFAALTLLAMVPNLLVVCLAGDVATAGQRLVYLLATLALYGCAMFLVHRRAYLYIISLGFPFSFFELIHLFTRGTTTTVLSVYTWIKTAPEELEAIYRPYGWLVAAGIAVWIGYYVLAHYFVEREYLVRLRWRVPLFAGLACLALLLPVYVCPTSVLHRYQQLARMALRIERKQAVRQQFSYGVTPNGSKAEETLIVVIGETSFDDWQSLGMRDTLLTVFEQAYTLCPSRGIGVPMTLTRAGAEHTAPFYDEPSVIRAFHEAGYYCAWLSNYGYHDHLLMRMADECRYMSYQPDQPDTALLVPYREAMAQPAQRHLCVLVTQGGHDSASLRQTPTLLRQLTDSLRTVHQPAMLVYIGHPTIRLTDGRQEMHGVVALWANANYRYRQRAMLRVLATQKKQPVSMETLFHSLLFWSGIDCALRDNSLCLGHTQYEAADTLRYLDENLHVQDLIP